MASTRSNRSSGTPETTESGAVQKPLPGTVPEARQAKDVSSAPATTELKPHHMRSGTPDVMQFALATGGLLLIGALYVILPQSLQVVPYWVVLAAEVALVVPIVIALASERLVLSHRVRRGLAFALLAVVTLALVSSVIALVLQLPSFSGGGQLLRAGVAIWVMNVLVFAVWYWETDGGGPVMRHKHGHRAADFQFPQQTNGDPGRWKPGFVDYLFLAFCSATALSPADTMPLTRPAKLLMMAEALISVTVLVVLVGRSVNII